MTKELVTKQASRNVKRLRALLSRRNHNEVFIMAGLNYLVALHPIEAWVPTGIELTVATGGIGQKMRHLKHWLMHPPFTPLSAED